MKVLVVTNQIPYPPYLGGYVRIFNLIKGISDSVELSLLLKSDSNLLKDADALRPYCKEMRVVPVTANRPLWLKFIRLFKPSEWRRTIIRAKLFLQGVPLTFLRQYSIPFRDELLGMVKKGEYDIIQFEFLESGQYILDIFKLRNAPGGGSFKFGKLVLVEHDITSVMASRLKKVKDLKRRIALAIGYFSVKRAEKKLLPQFDHIIAMSETDKEKLHSCYPDINDITVIKSGVDTDQFLPGQTIQSKQSLIFLGSMKFIPNRDGLKWFLNSIFPIIVKDKPDVVLNVIGEADKEMKESYASDRVIFHGILEKLETVMGQGGIFICPLRIGAGTKLKFVTAMAFGLPIVSTSIGAEGIAGNNEETMLIAENEQAFATAVLELFPDYKKQQRLGVNARLLAEQVYSWNVISKELLQLYEKLIASQNATIDLPEKQTDRHVRNVNVLRS